MMMIIMMMIYGLLGTKIGYAPNPFASAGRNNNKIIIIIR